MIRKKTKKKNLERLFLAFPFIIVLGVLVHKYAFAGIRLNSLRERCGGTNPKILYQYENGLITEYHKGSVVDGGYQIYDEFGRLLSSAGSLAPVRTPWFWLRKMTGRPIDYSYDMDSNDFCSKVEAVEMLGNLKVGIDYNWRLAKTDLFSGAVVDNDNSQWPGIVQIGKEPVGDVQKKEIASYIQLQSFADVKTQESVDQWLSDNNSDDSVLPPIGPQKVDSPNKWFSRDVYDVGSASLNDGWVEVTPHNFASGERKGEYVAYIALIKGNIVMATIYLNPEYPAIEDITDMLNSLISLNK